MASQSYELSTEAMVIFLFIWVIVFIIALAITLKSVLTLTKFGHTLWAWFSKPSESSTSHLSDYGLSNKHQRYNNVRKEE